MLIWTAIGAMLRCLLLFFFVILTTKLSRKKPNRGDPCQFCFLKIRATDKDALKF